MALEAGIPPSRLDRRFIYEPLLSPHPPDELTPIDFMQKRLRAPIWVSSMTGGTRLAGTINRNLARACREFGMGLGLGSCRSLLLDDSHFNDFNVRDLIGDDLPFYANLGIAQVEKLIEEGRLGSAVDLVERLRADGLVIHVNPLQEWLQPEGDRIKNAPIETIRKVLDDCDLRIVVKEVGQGMGPDSLEKLLRLPLEAVEFGAFGGTNFSRVELMRAEQSKSETFGPFTLVGHEAEEMLDFCNEIASREKDLPCRQIIISGGIRHFLQGHYLTSRSLLPAIYGQAAGFLKHARGEYSILQQYVRDQVRGLALARAYLRINHNQ